MDIEIKLDSNYNIPKVIIYTNKVTDEVNNILNNISMINSKKLTAFKDEKMYILNSDDIESVFEDLQKIQKDEKVENPYRYLGLRKE